MAYLYETHMHTRFGSLCGVSNGKHHAQYYKKLGFQGIIITDHFFGGNTGVPADLPWEKRVELFCLGYEDAWREGQRIGLDVFFGWEQNYQGDEYLIYGLDKEWLLKPSRSGTLEPQGATGGRSRGGRLRGAGPSLPGSGLH